MCKELKADFFLSLCMLGMSQSLKIFILLYGIRYLFDLILYVSVNSYGHVETVS